MSADFRISNHGSVVLVRPLTDDARAWVNENVHIEDWQWLGAAFGVDRRMAADFIDALEEAGFDIGGA